MVIVFFSYSNMLSDMCRRAINLGFLTSKSSIILLYTNSGAGRGGAAAPSRPPPPGAAPPLGVTYWFPVSKMVISAHVQ